jgi:hypothetical protein
LEVLRTGEGEEEILSKNYHGMEIPGQQECVGRRKNSEIIWTGGQDIRIWVTVACDHRTPSSKAVGDSRFGFKQGSTTTSSLFSV